MKWFDLNKIPRRDWFTSIRAEIIEGNSLAIVNSSDVDTTKYNLDSIDGEQSIAIFSSGTTGEAKLLVHPVSRLLGAPRKKSLRLGTFYSPDRMAGLQAVAHGISSGNDVSFFNFRDGANFTDGYRKPLETTHLSCTPSQLRFFDLKLLDRLPNLKSITLGGEEITGQDISSIKSVNPELKIFQIYASSEFGQMCTVKDERPGLPLTFFDQPDARFKISSDGELLFRNKGQDRDAFLPTGDLVVRNDDRVCFNGRKDLMVSIGGVMQSPHRVEQAMRSLDLVLDCSVRIKRSKFLGAMLIAEVIPTKATSVAKVQSQASALRSYERPQMIKLVSSFEISDSGKRKVAYD